jgi:GntR family transcriptional regulator, arabinose operon transcriptional repressor
MADHPKRIPMYQQIREYILDRIREQQWQPNDQIPSENELAEKFNVSRITIRGALSKLIEEGMIYRIQGKGSFISSQPIGEKAIYEGSRENGKKKIAYLMPRLDNLFTANLLSGIESEISVNGYHLIFCKTHDSREIETKLLREMMAMNVEGIIIYPAAGEKYNEEILKLTLNNYPLVVVDRYLRGVETNCVCADNFEGARTAVAHLIEMGHSKIGFVSCPAQTTTSIEDRLAGYDSALKEHDLQAEHRLKYLQIDMKQANFILTDGQADESTKRQIMTFLQENPDLTAVLAVNTAVGLSTMEAARELQISIPDDLSVIFFDDYEASSFSAIPPTCVSQQEYQLGREAAKLLVSLLNEPTQGRRKIVTPAKLIVRSSTGRR